METFSRYDLCIFYSLFTFYSESGSGKCIFRHSETAIAGLWDCQHGVQVAKP